MSGSANTVKTDDEFLESTSYDACANVFKNIQTKARTIVDINYVINNARIKLFF